MAQHIGYVQGFWSVLRLVTEHRAEKVQYLLLPAAIRQLLPVDLLELLDDQIIVCL